MTSRRSPAAHRACVGAVVLLAGCNGTAHDGASAKTAAPTTKLVANATVDYVIDGDTVDVVIDGTQVRMRLIGIDTPETKKKDTPIQCFGPEATKFTQSLLPVGTPIFVERDTQARDDYGRLLGYVFTVDTGTFVNLELARRGYARPLTIPPNVHYSDQFVQAARDAERNDVGLWHACRG